MVTMDLKNFKDIAGEDEMLDEIKAGDPASPFEESVPDFKKNVWDGEKFVTEAEYNASLAEE